MERGLSQTRERILRAAGDLFYRDGVLSVSVDAVAKRAGVTKRTLYYHFNSKDDLVTAYLEARNGPVQSLLMSWMTRAEGPLSSQIAALFAELARVGQRPNWKGCPFARVATELAGFPDHPALKVAARHKADFEAWLRHRIAAAELSDPPGRARQVMALIDGAITHLLIHRDPAYAEAAGRAAATVLGAPLPALVQSGPAP